MAFPISPVDGQTTTINGITYVYSAASNSWTRQPTGFVNIDAAGNISAAGNITGQNFYTAGEVSATGNITANYYFGNGSQLTGIAATSAWANSLIGDTLSSNVLYSSLTTLGTLANLSVSGNTTLGNFTFENSNISTNSTTDIIIKSADNNTTLIVSGGSDAYAALGWIDSGNLANANGSQNTNYIFVDVDGAFLQTFDPVSQQSYLLQLDTNGNLSAPSNVSAVGNIIGANLYTAGEVSATGNITGGNLSTGGTGGDLTLTGGNILGANVITANNYTSLGNVYITANANIWNFDTTGNLTAPGNISTTGNITANYYFGNGSQLTGVTAVSVDWANIANINNDYGPYEIAIGTNAGNGQNTGGIAIGTNTGNNQQAYSIAIGSSAGSETQGEYSVAVGYLTGAVTQGNAAIAVGTNSGQTTQGDGATAIGPYAGQTSQGSQAVAVGYSAGITGQGNSAVAIGDGAGYSGQGENAVAIGRLAGQYDQIANSIIINATGYSLNSSDAGLYIAPIRNDDINTGNVAFYNSETYEVTYANTISIAGNITGNNITAVGDVVGNNLLTLGVISGAGNITGQNFYTAGEVSATGNITGGNISTAGNITANYYFGNGSQLTDVVATNIYANALIGNTLSSNVLYSSLTSLGTLSNLSVSGNIDAQNASFANAAFATGNITLPTQLATKQYVDNAVSTGLQIHESVNVSTTTNLVSTYTPGGTTPTITAITGGNVLTSVGSNLSVNDQVIPSASSNGLIAGKPYFVYSAPNANSFTLTASWQGPQITSFFNGTGLSIPTVANPGIGATLTNAGTRAALVIDSIPLSVTNRVLVQYQANSALNGVYTVSNVGNATTNWVMTRSLDTDQYYPQSQLGIGAGAYFYVQSGNIVGGDSYVVTTPGIIVVGTTGIDFAQFSGAVTYTGVSPVVVIGQTISLANLTGTGDTVVLNNSPTLIAPNIGNAVGNSLSVVGNVQTANYFVGDGYYISNINAANVSTTKISNGNSQANIGTIGGNLDITISSNSVATFYDTGLKVTGAISAAGNVTGNYILGNGYFLTGVITSVANINNGTSNVTVVSADGNITVGVSGVGNVVVFAPTGEYVTGVLSASGNVTGSNLLTSGLISATSTITSAANIVGGNLLTDGLISATSTITAGQFIGNGNTISNIQGANVSGNVTSAVTAGTVTTNAQPNITSVGTLTSITSSGLVSTTGNLVGANILTSGQVSATGNITTSGYFVGNLIGNISGNITVPGANTQVLYNYQGNVGASPGFTFDQLTNAMVVSGNVTGANLLTAGQISAGGNIRGLNLNLDGSGQILWDYGSYIIENGASHALSVVGGTALALTTPGNLTLVSGGNTATFDYTTGNLSLPSAVSAVGNITGSYIIGNGSALTGINFSQLADANTAGLTINDVYLQGVTNLAVNHTGATAFIFDQYPGSNPTLYAIAGTTLAFDLTTAGHPFQIQDSGGTDYNTGLYHVTSTGVVSFGLAAQGKTSGTLYWKIPGDLSGNYKYQCANHPVMNGVIAIQSSNIANALSTYTGNITAGNISVAGNILTAVVSASGNITANYYFGNGSQLTGIITQVSNISNGTSNVNIASANANVTVSINGTPNVATFATTGEYVTGEISATGNITGNYIIGNGAILTGVNFSQLADANTANLTINEVYLQGVTNLVVNHTGATGYTFDQYPGLNPSLYAIAGTTLAFDLTTVGHPFQIQDSGGVDYNTGLYHVTTTGVVSTGVSAQGKTSGTLYWKIPGDLTGNYKYQCANHPVMNGPIVIQAANLGNALSTYTGDITAGNISVTGNITGANVNTANLSLSGNVVSDLNITGNVNANNANFVNGAFASGTVNLPTQLTTKQYVDNAVSSGLHIHQAVNVSTTTNLVSTYTTGGTSVTVTAISGGNLLTAVGSNLSVNDQVIPSASSNGLVAGFPYFVYSAPNANSFTLSAVFDGAQVTTFTNGTGLSIPTVANPGVGAYLTNAGTQAALVIDSVSVAVTNRVLVQFQSNGAQNGIYTVSNVGNATTNWVMTRSLDADQYYPQSDLGIGSGDYFFVQSGNTLGGSSYVLTTPGELVIGTTPLTFAQFSGAVVYTGVSPVVVSGQTISLANLTGTGDTVVLNNTPVLIAPNLGNATGNSVSVSGNVTADQVVSTVATGTAPFTVTSTTKVANLYVDQASLSDKSSVTFTAANVQYPTFAYAGLTGVYRLESNTNFSANFANGTFSALTFAGNLTGATASLTGNVIGGNVLFGSGIVSGTGNIFGNIITATTTNATTVSASGNVTGGNLLFGSGIVSGTGNIFGNIGTITTVNSTTVSASGNVTGGNILTSGQLITSVAIGTAPMVVTSNTRVANLNVASAGIADRANVTFAAANIQYPTFAYAGITGTYPLESNIAFSANFANGAFSATTFTGNLQATIASLSGNVTGGNILTGGLISATSTITSAANITGANILTAGLMSSTGNAIHGNVLTGGQVSATGNITTAGYFLGTFAGSISGNVTAPGANTQVVYNNSGNLAGSTGFTFDQSSNALVVVGNLSTGNTIIADGLNNGYYVSNVTSNGNLILQATNSIANRGFTSMTSQYFAQMQWVPNISNYNVYSATGANTNWIYVDQTGFHVENYTSGSGNNWSFNTNGNLILPHNAVIKDTTAFSISFGYSAGQISQSSQSVAIGANAGYNNQGSNAVALGSFAGNNNQGNNSAAFGFNAGANTQGINSVAIGWNAGSNNQSANSVAIGRGAGQDTQGTYSLAIGWNAALTNQGSQSTAIGIIAGQTNQGNSGVAIGYSAGGTAQGVGSLAIGTYAGGNNQGSFSTAFGYSAGNTSQGNNSVAIGVYAGNVTQGSQAVAIGYFAGNNNQGNYSVALGYAAGYTSQLGNSVAIGSFAGYNGQPAGAVAIGYAAGYYQTATSIVLNGTGAILNGNAAGFFVAPVRNDTGNISNVATYNTTTKELIYSNTISLAGNISGGNILTTGLMSSTGNAVHGNILTAGSISATGNITGNYIVGNGSLLTSITGGNVTGQVGNALIAGTVYTNAQPNITSVGTLTSLSVTGNTTGGNLLTGGLISATSTITSAANITGANLLTGGLISATSTITSAANITGANILTGGLISSAGNVISGNVLTSGQVSATGNITTAGYFLGTFAGSISGNVTAPGSNTQVVYNNSGNLAGSTGFTFNQASNALVVTGNITGANITTAGVVTATGNITGGNVITAGQVSAVGNVSVGNASAVTWANATGTRAYTYYNNATSSLDTVFI